MMSRRIRNIIALLMSAITLNVIAGTPPLPVLKIEFPGKIHKDMDYIFGSMRLTDEQGQTVELSAKFKTRGATALSYSMKPSLNMKLREPDGTEKDSMLLGLRSCSSWILDAMAIDQICMRNRVCFDIWNSFAQLPYYTEYNGRNGTIGKFVEMYINNEYYGIYCLNDRINRKLLNLKKVKTGIDGDTIRGVLYKQGTTDIGDQNTPGYFNDYTVCVAQWHDAWELTYPEDYAREEAWAPLQEYYRNYGNYSYIKEHFFLDNLVDYTLFVMAFAISDNWGNKNKYFSIRNINKAEDNRNCIVVTPWDLDTSLGGNYNGSYYGGNYSNWPITSIVSSASPPFSACLREKEFQNMLRERWIELREYELSIASVADRLYKYCNLFYETGAWQRQQEWMAKLKYKPRHCTDLRQEVNMIVQWYQDRFAELDRYFGIDTTPVKDAVKTTSDKSTRRYTINGNPATSDYRGIIVQNGKKILMR